MLQSVGNVCVYLKMTTKKEKKKKKERKKRKETNKETSKQKSNQSNKAKTKQSSIAPITYDELFVYLIIKKS